MHWLQTTPDTARQTGSAREKERRLQRTQAQVVICSARIGGLRWMTGGGSNELMEIAMELGICIHTYRRRPHNPRLGRWLGELAMLRMLTGCGTEVRVSLCSEPVAANLAGPQTLAAQSQTRPPRAQTATLPDRRRPLRPSSLQLASPVRPTRTRPTCTRPAKHQLPFSTTHSPFLSAPSFYLPLPIHYIDLLSLCLTVPCTTHHGTRQHHGARNYSIPASARVSSSFV